MLVDSGPCICLEAMAAMEMEALMERVRFKQAAAENSGKSLADTSKMVRMNMADRRHSLDTVDKAILRYRLGSRHHDSLFVWVSKPEYNSSAAGAAWTPCSPRSASSP